MFHYLRDRKFIALTAVLLALILFLVSISIVSYVDHRETLQRTRTVAETLIQQTEAAFEQIPPLTAQEQSRLRSYLNPIHVETATQRGIANLQTREAIAKQIEERDLVRLEDNPYFYLQEMNYSVPAVVPNMADLLYLIGRQFQDTLRASGIPPYRYTITSATRSRKDQAALQQTNVNAASRSSHEFGTTVDVHYDEFDLAEGRLTLPDSLASSSEIYPNVLRDRLTEAYERLARTHTDALKALLGRTLLSLQREGDVIVIYERRQPVYHITVSDSIPRVALPSPGASPPPT